MKLVHRVLFVAWQDPATRRIYPVGRLLDHGDAPRWEFAYIQAAREAALAGFLPFLGLRDLDVTYRSVELPPFFANRLMPKNRPDLAAFLTSLDLPVDIEDEIPILARSEGRRATDTIELFGLPTFDEVLRVYRSLFFARGIRHVPGAEERIARLAPGERLNLRRDPTNPTDSLAIRVCGGEGEVIGYVPNTLLEDLHGLEEKSGQLEVVVARINASPAPVQLRLLCRMEATAVDGFVPFATPRYDPIPADATRIHLVPQEFVG